VTWLVFSDIKKRYFFYCDMSIYINYDGGFMVVFLWLLFWLYGWLYSSYMIYYVYGYCHVFISVRMVDECIG